MNKNNVFIKNESEFQKRINAMKVQGVDRLHILADFDRTLSKANFEGTPVTSAISILRDEGYLGKEYSQKAQDLYNHYSNIEIDQNISKKDKKAAMQERRQKHLKIMKQYGLSMSGLEFVAEHGRLSLREHGKEMFELLNENNIPLVIMSASGLGVDSINLFLRKQNINMDNVYVISNRITWDKKGKMTGWEEPVIHAINKSEVILHEFPEIYKQVKDRKNIILLGDSINDLDMVDGFEYQNLISVGFCNYAKSIEEFKKKYDITIINDGNMKEVIKILRHIIQK